MNIQIIKGDIKARMRIRNQATYSEKKIQIMADFVTYIQRKGVLMIMTTDIIELKKNAHKLLLVKKFTGLRNVMLLKTVPDMFQKQPD